MPRVGEERDAKFDEVTVCIVINLLLADPATTMGANTKRLNTSADDVCLLPCLDLRTSGSAMMLY